MTHSTPHPSLELLLEDARRRIQVEPDELAEARTRRNEIGAVLRQEFGGPIYVNGSVAHGDALNPLTDVDLGVVVPNLDGQYGPGRKGPAELKERAAKAVRDDLKDSYDDLRVEVKGHKRSVLIRFREPVHHGAEDFTADIIVALDNPDAPGFLIPRFDTWDCSHPTRHTDLVISAIKSSEVRYARVVRLVKHWNRMLPAPVVCSWHIKVLALDCVRTPGTLVDGLQEWFDCAERALRTPTPDPARVGPDIKTLVSPSEAARRAGVAAALMREAVQLEQTGYRVLAHDKLAQLFNDPEMLPAPPRPAVIAEEVARLGARTEHRTHSAAPALVTPAVRSWGL